MAQKMDECKSRFKDCYGNHKSGGGGWLAGMNAKIVLRIATAITNPGAKACEKLCKRLCKFFFGGGGLAGLASISVTNTAYRSQK